MRSRSDDIARKGAGDGRGLFFSFYEAQQHLFDPRPFATSWVNALFALPAPLLLVILARRKLGSQHSGSVMLAGFVAWILCIHKVTAARHGGHHFSGDIFALPTAVLFVGPFVSLAGFGITLALLIGSKPVRYCLRFALLAGVAIGAYSLAASIAERRRVETQELPSVLRRIYEAEMYYSAGRPDKGFTCDVTQLQANIAIPRAQYAGTPGWYAKTYPNQSVAELTARNYTAQVVCLIERMG